MAALPVLLVCAFASGVALALIARVPATLWLAALVLVFVGATLAILRARTRLALAGGLAGLACAGAALGAAADARARAPVLDRLADVDGPLALEGTLLEDASTSATGVRLRLAITSVEGARADGAESVALTVSGELASPLAGGWRAGRALRLSAGLRRPAHYRNPGVPDDRLALARRGLTLVGSVKSGALVEIAGHGSWRQERSADLRAFVRRTMERRVAPHGTAAAAVATAILIGDRAGLDVELEQKLQAAGTYHVIAISGGNIAVLATALLGLSRLLRLSTVAGSVVVATLLVVHAGLVGAGASVARATSMAVIYFGLRAIDQSAWNVNALAAACGVLLVASPLALVDPGFLLSAGATAAILLLAHRLPRITTLTGWQRAAAGVAGASLATELVLLPITATLFHRVTFAGLLLNLAAVPLMAVVQIAASATVLAELAAPALADIAALVTAGAARALIGSSGLVDLLPWLAQRTPPPPWWLAALYLSALGATVALTPRSRSRQRRWLRVTAGAVATLSALAILAAPGTWRWPWRADGLLRVVALDVGQGDSTLVEFPDGRRWLIDAGGLPGATRYDIGARVVAPALWARGTGRLDALLLTHGDPDHIGGAASVLDDFGPSVLDGIPVPPHVPLRQLRDRARQRRRPWRTVRRGERADIGGVSVRVLHPPEPDWERQRVRNDDSVVIELRFGDVSIVLPGDIGGEVEGEIGKLIPPAPIRILKAAHHGSATSTTAEWLGTLRPDAVIVSCGRENRYGHPAGDVLSRLREGGIEVFRTDLDGQVVVETDGTNAVISAFDVSLLSTITKTTMTSTKVATNGEIRVHHPFDHRQHRGGRDASRHFATRRDD